MNELANRMGYSYLYRVHKSICWVALVDSIDVTKPYNDIWALYKAERTL